MSNLVEVKIAEFEDKDSNKILDYIQKFNNKELDCKIGERNVGLIEQLIIDWRWNISNKRVLVLKAKVKLYS